MKNIYQVVLLYCKHYSSETFRRVFQNAAVALFTCRLLLSYDGRRQIVELTGSGNMTMCPPGRLVSATHVLKYHGPQKTWITRWGKWQSQYLPSVTCILVFLGFLWGSKCDIWYAGHVSLFSGIYLTSLLENLAVSRKMAKTLWTSKILQSVLWHP